MWSLDFQHLIEAIHSHFGCIGFICAFGLGLCVCVCVCVYVESTMSLGQLKPEKLTKVSSIPRIFVEEAKGEAGRWQVTRPSGEGG